MHFRTYKMCNSLNSERREDLYLIELLILLVYHSIVGLNFEAINNQLVCVVSKSYYLNTDHRLAESFVSVN